MCFASPAVPSRCHASCTLFVRFLPSPLPTFFVQPPSMLPPLRSTQHVTTTTVISLRLSYLLAL